MTVEFEPVGDAVSSGAVSGSDGTVRRRCRGLSGFVVRLSAAVAPQGVALAMSIAGGLLVLLIAQLAIADPAAHRTSPAGRGSFVGGTTCAACHQAQAREWKGSHHDLAMQPASQTNVLGNFSDASFEQNGVRSRFFRREGRFYVTTDGPNGTLETFEISYTFGVYPLQQYLIAFPDGRLQALSIAWDSRPFAAGGQRWFHLYAADRIGHDDPLHWTRPAHNWNHMCADCHSTGVRKNYDAVGDRFSTTWSEINVSCEACHGAGARHVAWASGTDAARSADPTRGFDNRFNERRDVIWRIDPSTGTARRSAPPSQLRREVEACGLCHARRGSISEDWKPGAALGQTHEIALLQRGLFEADGQMLDEVYNYQSFLQSRMFAAGVTCGDCHDPHNLKLRADGSGVCHQCHDPIKFETALHRGHSDSSVTCIACHMPQRTYMSVDSRHDHSFRVPRPDLSVTLGTPNACTDCHRDKPAQWAADTVVRWHGPTRKSPQAFAIATHAARQGQADAAALLAHVIQDTTLPGITRGSAFLELGSLLSADLLSYFRRGLDDPDPLVRLGALRGLQTLPIDLRRAFAGELLNDPVRTVRMEAVLFLAPLTDQQLVGIDRATFDRAAEEFIAASRLNADRAEARINLGNFFAQRARPEEAEAEYLAAIRLEPAVTGAAINLADLYRSQQRDSDAEKVLRQAMTRAPNDAAVVYGLGLTLVRLRRPAEALELLAKAAALEPEHSRYTYVYGIALNSAGRPAEAVQVLERNHLRHTRDIETLSALFSINHTLGRTAAAVVWGEKLLAVAPETPGLRQLLDAMRGRAPPSQAPLPGPRR